MTLMCPICDCPDWVIVIRVYDWRFRQGKARSLVRCQACSCHYLWPRPEALESEYPQDYPAWQRQRSSSSGRFKSLARAGLRWVAGGRAFDFTDAALRTIRKLGTEGERRVLDVGAGRGWFLDHCRNLGLETTGLDVSETALRGLAQAGHSTATWETLADHPNEYDLITLHHVLEHFGEPVRRLAELRSCLREDGRVIIVVPRIDCWCFRAFGEFYNQLDGGRHLVMYSPATLADAVQRAGFNVHEVRTYAKASNAYNSWCRAARAKKKHSPAISALYTAAYRPLAYYVSHIGQGEILELMASG